MARLKRIWRRAKLIVLMPDHVMGIAPAVKDAPHGLTEATPAGELQYPAAKVSQSHSGSGA